MIKPISTSGSDDGYEVVFDNGPRYTLDSTYYCEDVVLLVEHYLFRIHRAILEQSPTFASRYLLAVEGSSLCGRASSDPILIEGYAAEDFRQLLRVLLPLQHGKKPTFSASQCMSVLKLSTEWQFHSVRQSMIEELLPYTQDDPVLKIIAAKKYDILEWLVPGVNALAQREDALSEPDVQRFQLSLDNTPQVMKLVLNIAKVRESWSGQPSGCRSKHDFTKAICTIFACGINGRKMTADVTIASKVPELVESANASHQCTLEEVTRLEGYGEEHERTSGPPDNNEAADYVDETARSRTEFIREGGRARNEDIMHVSEHQALSLDCPPQRFTTMSDQSTAHGNGSQKGANTSNVEDLALAAHDNTKAKEEEDSPALVERIVGSLLMNLTTGDFDSISDEIIAQANKSEHESDGRTLIQVTRLVYESAIDNPTRSKVHGHLCWKMMNVLSPKVRDESIKNSNGKPIVGGLLFRQYLLNHCQDDFERNCASKKAAAAPAAAPAAASRVNKKDADAEIELYSDEYYVSQNAKRQGFGLVTFLSELFKLHIVTESMMHECVQKLLDNDDNPEEEDIESLCALLTRIGNLLDTSLGRPYLNLYFMQMRGLAENPKATSRMRHVLLEVAELRDRKWVSKDRSRTKTPSLLGHYGNMIAQWATTANETDGHGQ